MGTWEDELREFLRTAARVVVLGVGNKMRADDGAGTLVAEMLSGFPSSIPLLGVPGGSAPENFTGPIKAFAPSHIVIVDAVSSGLPPGSIRPIRYEALSGVSLSSHTLPLKVIGDYFRQEGLHRQFFLGIEAGTAELGAPMSQSVEKACRKVVSALRRCLAGRCSA